MDITKLPGDTEDPESPKPCRRGHARVQYDSETTGRTVAYCRTCARDRYARFLARPEGLEKRRESQRAYERRGRTPMETPPARPSPEAVRADFLSQGSARHWEAIIEVLGLIEAGVEMRDALDEVLHVVGQAEVEAALVANGSPAEVAAEDDHAPEHEPKVAARRDAA
jgi:hypothetical protein